MKDLTVIMPAFNEEDSLLVYLPKVIEFCGQNEVKIIIINDGSSDKTKDILEEISREYLFLTVIHHKINKGYGAALKTGLNIADSKYIISLDTDGQHNVDDISELYKSAIFEDADMVVGCRSNQASSSRYRSLGKLIIRLITRFLIKTNIHDLNTGMKLMDSTLARSYSVLCPNDFSYSNIVTLIFISQGHKVIERRVKSSERIGGKSTVSSRTAFDTVLEIVNIIMFFNPMKIFGFISLILFSSGLLWSIPILLQGKGVSVGSMMLIVIGIIFFMLGLIAHQISLLNKAIMILDGDKIPANKSL